MPEFIHSPLNTSTLRSLALIVLRVISLTLDVIRESSTASAAISKRASAAPNPQLLCSSRSGFVLSACRPNKRPVLQGSLCFRLSTYCSRCWANRSVVVAQRRGFKCKTHKTPRIGSTLSLGLLATKWVLAGEQAGYPLVACFCMVSANTELLAAAGLIAHLRSLLVKLAVQQQAHLCAIENPSQSNLMERTVSITKTSAIRC